MFLLLAGIAHAQNLYSTNFPAAEEPIYQNGRWTNGRAAGLDWSDVKTIPGFAFPANPVYKNFNDPIAILVGTWGATQTASITVVCNRCDNVTVNEVEIELNATIRPHDIKGYEISCRVPDSADAYFLIVRWNGAFENFTTLNKVSGKGCRNGDVFSATSINGVITGYLNGVAVITARDKTFREGAPGIGFNSCGPPQTPAQCANSFSTYGISSFSASNTPPLWSGRHYNLKTLTSFILFSLSLFLIAAVTMTLIFRDVDTALHQRGDGAFRHWGVPKFGPRRATADVWREHVRSFRRSNKRWLFALCLITAAITAVGYVLWLFATSTRTIHYR